MGNFAFALAGDGSDTLELDVYSVIGESFWFDSVSASAVRRRLKENGKAKLIKLRIHSEGGDVFDAQAIYADLQAHPARVEAEITGLACSAATLIAMAADHIRMAEGAWFMIHNPWGGLAGEADALRAWADVLDKMKATFADVYSKRSGQAREKVLALMAAESWMTAAEAKANGFVDEVLPAKSKAKAAASRGDHLALRAAARVFADGEYQNPPEILQAQFRALASAPPSTDPAPGAPGPSPEPPTPAPAPPAGPPETSMISKAVAQALNIPEDAEDSVAEAAIKKLKANASAGTELESMLGVSGSSLVGAVRALKETSAANEALAAQVSKLTIVNNRRDFDAAMNVGLKEKKNLTPAVAKLYQEKFDKAVAALATGGTADAVEAVVADLQGFVAVASRTHAPHNPPPPGGGTDPTALSYNGKTYDQMSFSERASLSKSDPDLWRAMKTDWEAKQAA
jgi:ATP-dependent Clp endopeptidase proteolytic subunit ClpP